MRLQDDIIDTENRLSKTFMRWRVVITVWPNTPTSLQPNEFLWVIRFQSRDGVNFNWTIPWPDLYSILTDLARDMNQDVAEVIYEALGERFNETLRALQMELSPIREGAILPNVTQIQFPPREYFREELQLIEIEKWSRLHPTAVSTITTIGNANRATMGNIDEFYRERYLTYDHAPVIRAWDISAWASPTSGVADYVNYLTSEEYERKKADGELNPNTVYLVFNQH